MTAAQRILVVQPACSSNSTLAAGHCESPTVHCQFSEPGSALTKLAAAHFDALVLHDCDERDSDGFSSSLLRSVASSEDRPAVLVVLPPAAAARSEQWWSSGADELLFRSCDGEAEWDLAGCEILRMHIARAIDRRRLERQRGCAQDALQNATLEACSREDEIQSIASALSHDLKAPARRVMGFSELMERNYADDLDPKAREFLGFIHDAGDEMTGIVNSMVARLRSASRAPDPEAVDLADLFDSLRRAFGAQLRECGAQLDVDVAGRVRGVRAHLKRLFGNLIENALLYRRADRPPVIRVRAERDGARVCIQIEDEGVGFAEGEAEAIFEAFHRLGSVDVPGQGLGLALCRRIANAHGGSIRARGRCGEGAVVRVELPANA